MWGENCFIGFKSLVFKAYLEKGVVVQHQALVEWVSIKADREVPAMATILTPEDASKLKPVSGDSTKFAKQVRCVNSITKGSRQ